MRYVLHIGLPKTGSTSLQAFLSGNAGLLLEHGIVYPCGPAYPHQRQHSWILQALAEPDGALGQLLRACRGHDLAVISGEDLTKLTPAQVTALRLRLVQEGGASEVAIILYVRNIADLVLALCAEWVKLNGRAYHETIAQQHWSIGSVIGTWEEVFGKAAVDVRLLEDARPSLEQDFCAASGLPWLADYAVPERLNQTPDPLSAQMLRLLEIEFGRDRSHRVLLQTGSRMPRLENHYLAQISQVIGRVDLSHPKLACFGERLTAVRWRDETSGADVVSYLNGLIASLLLLRNQAMGAVAKRDGAK